jgi:hypothetical protein
MMPASCPAKDVSSPIWSHSCGLDDLLAQWERSDEVTSELELTGDWPRRWVTTWKTATGDLVCPVRDLAEVPTVVSVPVRRFSWRSGQRHRPGLAYMTSTGRQHGFESLAEHKLLLVLDFVGGVQEVLAQPFRLRFISAAGSGEHIPDFLALAEGPAWLLDVRPAGRIKAKDALRFAAAAQAADAAGWRYSVVTGWRQQVMTNIDTLSAQRRPLADHMGLHLGCWIRSVIG